MREDKKMKKNFKNIFRTLLCLCLVGVFTLGLISCDKGKAEQTDDTPKEGEVEVVRMTVSAKKGEQISEDKVYIDYVDEKAIPLNALRTLDEVVGKYLTADVVKDDYLFRARLADTYVEESEVPDTKAYVSVKANITEGADNTAEIQKLIDENPGRTLYFADGTYTVSKSLQLLKKTSFELADYAIIKAADSWSEGDAIIKIVGDDTDASGILGGTIDGNGKARGIEIVSGRDSTITDVTVKNMIVGIILGGEDARTVVENTDIVGMGDTSVGIEIAGNNNELDIVQIDNCKVAVKVTGKNNDLRSVHVTYRGNSLDSVGFAEYADSNHYDFCYAESFATGFFMSESSKNSEYGSCLVWWSTDIAKQVGFAAEGKFNSVIRTSRVNFESAEADSAYLTVGEEGGVGLVLWPIVKNLANIDDNTFKSYLGNTKLTEDME